MLTFPNLQEMSYTELTILHRELHEMLRYRRATGEDLMFDDEIGSLDYWDQNK